MNKKFNIIIVLFFLLNSFSIWIYWTTYIVDFENNNLLFAQNLASFMITHISSEYSIGVVTLIACILLFLRSKQFGIIWNFALGMHFYAALQATGWAFAAGMYPVFGLMSFNALIALFYLFYSVRVSKKETKKMQSETF